MTDARTITAVRAACPQNTATCRYPSCACGIAIPVRAALQAADEWDAAHNHTGIGMSDRIASEAALRRLAEAVDRRSRA